MKEEGRNQATIPSARSAATWLLSVIGILIFLTSVSSESFGAPKTAQDVVAKWGNKVITKQDVEARIASLPMEYQMRIQTEEQKQEFVEGIVQMEVLGAEAKAKKLDKEKVMVVRIADMVNSLLAQEYMKKILADVKKPTDKEIEQYYQSHKGEYVIPAQVKAQHILVRIAADAKPEEVAAAKTKAEDIRKELLAGGDFAKLAEKYSDDPGSKPNGGDLGFFSQDKMIPEFSQVAFSMKKDEISQPVKTGYGFHLIKVNEINPEKQMNLQDETPAIQSSLENAGREAMAEKELERLKKKYKVRITAAPREKK